MADLNEVRAQIDAIDPQIRQLLMQRMDCSEQVLQAKLESGNTKIYRADREAQILDTLGATVPEDRRAQYLAVERKIIETSRMHQYGTLLDRKPELFDTVKGHELADHAGEFVTVHLTRPNKPNGLSPILCMVGDYGFNMERLDVVRYIPAEDGASEIGTAEFQLVIRGDLTTTPMRKLMFQLSEESMDFCIVSNE